jgi:hypothetical protein
MPMERIHNHHPQIANPGINDLLLPSKTRPGKPNQHPRELPGVRRRLHSRARRQQIPVYLREQQANRVEENEKHDFLECVRKNILL